MHSKIQIMHVHLFKYRQENASSLMNLDMISFSRPSHAKTSSCRQSNDLRYFSSQTKVTNWKIYTSHNYDIQPYTAHFRLSYAQDTRNPAI